MYPVVARTLLGPSAKRFTRFEIPTRTVTVHRSTAKNKYKKVALKKNHEKVGGSVRGESPRTGPTVIRKVIRRIDRNEDVRGSGGAPLLFCFRRVALCCYVCCHNYFIEKLISPFPKHSPISVCETQRLNNSS